jgi:hypothetical protein
MSAALVWAVSTPAHAIQMSFDTVFVDNLGSWGFTSTSSVFSTDSGVTDQLYQMFGWVGTAGDVVRVNAANFDATAPISLTSPTLATSQLTLNATGAAALGLDVGDLVLDYSFTIADAPMLLASERFRWDVDITNASDLSPSPQSIDLSFYSYLDLDLEGTINNDLADWNGQRMLVTDDGTGTEFVWRVLSGGNFADHFEIAQYPGVIQSLQSMSSAQNLSDTQASFGPGDFTGALQFDYTLAPGETSSNGGLAGPVPEPGTAALVGCGLIGIAVVGRRI